MTSSYDGGGWSICGDFQCDAERVRPLRSRCVATDAHLDADDEIAIGVGDGDRIGRRHQPDVLAFANHDGVREPVDASERDMKIGENANLAWFDHMLAEAREISRAGAAGVDRSSDA